MNYELINNYARVFLSTLVTDQVLDNVNYLIEKFDQIKNLSSLQDMENLFSKDQNLANSLLLLLKKNGRIELLPEILQTLIYLYQEKHAKDIKVYLAPGLKNGSEEDLHSICLKADEIIRKNLQFGEKDKIEIDFIVDHSLIWGFKIQIFDMVLDYSLSSMIKRCLK